MNARQYDTSLLSPHITRVMVLEDFLALPHEQRTSKQYITQNEIAKSIGKPRAYVSYLAKAGIIIPRYIVNTDKEGLVMKLFNANDIERALELHKARDYEGLYRHWESVCARYIPF